MEFIIIAQDLYIRIDVGICCFKESSYIAYCEIGFTGPPGTIGEDGRDGIQGPKGRDGDRGPTGPGSNDGSPENYGNPVHLVILPIYVSPHCTRLFTEPSFVFKYLDFVR